MAQFETLHLVVHDPDGDRPLRLTCRTAEIMRRLIKVGDKGLTQLGVIDCSTRLAAYICDLRSDHGLIIETEREDHDDGWHARYKLGSAVSVRDPLADRAAEVAQVPA